MIFRTNGMYNDGNDMHVVLIIVGNLNYISINKDNSNNTSRTNRK